MDETRIDGRTARARATVWRLLFSCIVCLTVVLLSPANAAAQSATTGAVAGVARDTTGAVLPGVTVEVASPALIEKIRTAVTDGEGQFRVVDLRPGTYSVTFTLPGFSTFKRDGVELTTGFTANVNAEMKVGSLEETITVSGASPVVDIQNVQSQTVLSRETQDAIPTGRTYAGFAALTLGAKGANDVGGNQGENTSIVIHNSRTNDGKLTIDGMNFNHADGVMGGGLRAYYTNQNVMQEVALSTGSAGAEWETGGVNVNFIPKDGGNLFALNALANFTNGALQSSNLNDRLRARGTTTAPYLKEISDVGTGAGGPIVRDRVWFYSGIRRWHAKENQPGAYWNKTQDTLFYTPDLDRPGFSDSGGWDISQRLTWQAGKHKLAFYGSRQNTLQWGGGSVSLAPEAVGYSDYRPQWLTQGSWNYPATNHLLIEAGATYVRNPVNVLPADYFARANLGDISPEKIRVVDSGLGITYGNAERWRRRKAPNANAKFAVSYITGAHAFKTGLSVMNATNKVNVFAPTLQYTFRNRVPLSIAQFAYPLLDSIGLNTLALYSQDQWTIRKLTLNLGVRFDYMKGYVDEVPLPGGPFMPPTVLPAATDLPNWKDIVPRFGAAYDLFGNGKTAIKGAFGKYVVGHGVDVAIANSPSGALSLSTSRIWNDSLFGAGDPRTGNYVPDCELTSPVLNGECGPFLNNRFGTVVPASTYADDVRRGWGVRDYSWQGQLSLQQELRPGVAVNLAYFRTWYGNFTVTDNLATTPADYSSYCVTSPVDARLPGGGGQALCGLADISPPLVSSVDNLVTQASNYGKRTDVFDGIDIGLAARFGRGGQLNGGVSLGRTVTDTCAVVESPQEARPGFCRTTLSWWEGQGQIKFNAIYPLPWWGLQASGTYQNLAGALMSATAVFTNAQILPSLKRNLSTGASGTVTIPITPPNTWFEDRRQQIDVRLTKIVRLGRARLQGNFDVYNLFNANTILGSNPAMGANFLVPTTVLAPRTFKVGMQLDF